MKIHDVRQNSPQWHQLRAGIPTASRFHDIVTPAKGELSASSEAYMCWLLAEFMVGHQITGPETDAMARGSMMEERAAKMFSFVTGLEVETVGFYTTEDCMIGASPDRKIVGLPKGVEIKSPLNEGIHVQNLIGKGIEAKSKPQLQGQLWVCEFDSVFAVSYHPDLPIAVQEVGRDEKYITKMAEALRQFIDTLLAKRIELEQRYGPFVRPKPDSEQGDDVAGLGIDAGDVDLMWSEIQRREGIPDPRIETAER